MSKLLKASSLAKIILLSLLLTASSLAHSQAISKYADFPGGINAFFEFVRNEMQYPPAALEDSVEGNVYVNFLINADGDVVAESAFVTQGVTTVLDEEALRIIRRSPRWIPAKRPNGQSIQQVITIPVSFKRPVENE